MDTHKKLILIFAICTLNTTHEAFAQIYIVIRDCVTQIEPPKDKPPEIISIRIDVDHEDRDYLENNFKDISYHSIKNESAKNLSKDESNQRAKDESANIVSNGIKLTSSTKVLRLGGVYIYKVKVLTGEQTDKILYLRKEYLKKDGDQPIFAVVDDRGNIIEKSKGIRAGTSIKITSGEGYRIKVMDVSLIRGQAFLQTMKGVTQYVDMTAIINQSRAGDKIVFSINRVVEVSATGEELTFETDTARLTISVH